MARKPDSFANIAAGVRNDVWEISWQDISAHLVTPCGPTSVACHLALICDPLETKCTWRDGLANGHYILLLYNIRENVPSQGKEGTKLCTITVAHKQDSYLNLEVSQDLNFISLRIQFYGMLDGFPCRAPSFEVMSYDAKR